MPARLEHDGVHWHYRIGADRICVLTLDKQGSSSNSLSQDVLAELSSSLDLLRDQAGLVGVIVISGKASGFIPGADIGEFDSIATPARGAELAATGQAILARLEDLGIPSCAAINGYALGGGLELALACTYRVAVTGYQRNLGLPEVQLGIHPGFGGTVRAVRLLGVSRALDLMVSGRQLSPVEALRLGLLDRLCEPDSLLDGARRILLDRPPVARAPLSQRLLNLWPLRRLIARKVVKEIARKVPRAHYPAPYQIVELWRRYGGRGDLAYRAEAESIGRLFLTPTSRNLVRVFKLRERLKNLAPKSSAVARVHVIGAGVMGGDIAAWCALRGLSVSLQDSAPAAIDASVERASRLFERRLRAPGAADAARERLRPDPDGSGVAGADVVIEAIVERLDVKRQVFAELEGALDEETILSSNTSSLRIEDMAAQLSRPGRLIGLHFFNPVAQLPLVEVVYGAESDPNVVERGMGFIAQIGKLPLPCRSAPGFVVNRILTPYMIEALRAYEDGHGLEEIDAAAVGFGMPVGPIQLADQVGLDIALHVAEILGDIVGGPPPSLLTDMVGRGDLGQKTGQGFYRYVDRKPQRKPHSGPIDPKLVDRLLLPLVNEAVACVDEGIVDDFDLVDAGAVFGTGFAPFRGGPIRYALDRGIDDIVAQLHTLAAEHGARFEPHQGWSRLADIRD